LELRLDMEYADHPALSSGLEKNYVAVSIKDEGEGIPENNVNHLFEPFFTTKGVGEGTGLGLSIAYGIVQEHGGWIDVQSKVGEGTCFTIYIPLEVDECAEKS
jgi:two-component system NtrC family sensor kinase